MSKKDSEKEDNTEKETVYQVELSPRRQHAFYGILGRKYLLVATNLDDEENAILLVAKDGKREVAGTLHILPNQTKTLNIDNPGRGIFIINTSDMVAPLRPKIGVSIVLVEF